MHVSLCMYEWMYVWIYVQYVCMYEYIYVCMYWREIIWLYVVCDTYWSRETELSEIMNFLSSDTCTSVSAVKSILKNGFLFPSFLIFHTISTKASYKVELRINAMEGGENLVSYNSETAIVCIIVPSSLFVETNLTSDASF